MSRWARKQFEVGDRVRCVDNSHHSNLVAIGSLGTVAASPCNGDFGDHYVMVLVDGDTTVRGWHEYRWEHASGNLMPDTRDYLETITG